MELSIEVLSNDYISLFPILIDLNSDYNSVVKSEAFGTNKRSSHPCTTCKQYSSKCFGHWGRVGIPAPLVRPAFIPYVNKILSILCLHCGLKIPISKIDYEILSSTYLLSKLKTKTYKELVSKLRREYNNAGKGKCRLCSRPAHKFQLNHSGVFSNGSSILSHEHVYRLFHSIPFFLYPIFTSNLCPLEELFFSQYYPLIPLYLRHSYEYYKKDILIDSHITKSYIDMITKISSNDAGLVQQKINEIELNDSVIPNSYISQVFIGKGTIFRQLINSNRGDNTTRVILNANQSAFPEDAYFCKEFYQILASKIYLSKYTLSLVLKLLDNKLVKYYYSPEDNIYVSLQHNNKSNIRLNYGGYVEVLLNDLLTVNYSISVLSYRQPSLHKGSVVANRVKPNPSNWFNGNSNCLSTTVLQGMNGDQDGDEFNTRLITDIRSLYEHQYIMQPRFNLIAESNGGIAYGMIQNEILLFIRLGLLYGSNFYKHYLPKRLRDAEFEAYTTDEVGVTRKVNTLYKNILDLVNPVAAYRFLTSLIRRVKLELGAQGLSFMSREIYDDISFHLETKAILKLDLLELQNQVLSKDYNDILDFIKLKLSELNKKYEQRYKEWISKLDVRTSDYALIALSGLKVNPRILSEAFALQKSEKLDDISNYYYYRSYPYFPSHSKDIRAYGCVTNSYFIGLSFQDMTYTFYPVLQKLIIQTRGTALPGKISRDLIKTMEDVHINSLKFVVHYNTILDPTINIYKLPNTCLYLLPLVKQDLNDLLNENITSYNESYDLLYKYIVNLKELSFPLDLPFIIKNLHTLLDSSNPSLNPSLNPSSNPSSNTKSDYLTNEVKTKMILDFAEYIHINYLYSFGTVKHLLTIILLAYLYKVDLTKNQLEYILNLIETKYKLYPLVGMPVGVMTALTVGEIMTQSALANFHTSKKGGEEVNLSDDANNINFLQLRNKVDDGIVTMTALTTNAQTRLILIKVNLEFCCLNYLNLNIIKHSNSKYTLEVDIIKCTEYSLSRSYIEDLIAININELSYIKSASIQSSKSTNKIIIDLMVEFIDNNQLYPKLFELLIPYFMKGLYSENRFTHKRVTHNLYDTTQLIFMNSNHSIFRYYDTSAISITLPVENMFKYTNIMCVYNMLSNNYVGNQLVKNHFRQVAIFQCRYNKPIKIKKSNTSELSLISRMSHQKTYYDMQSSALLREPQVDSIASSIFLNQPIPIGTGYYKLYTDITPYIKSSKLEEKEIKLDELLI